jgi:hypothetical protein
MPSSARRRAHQPLIEAAMMVARAPRKAEVRAEAEQALERLLHGLAG